MCVPLILFSAFCLVCLTRPPTHLLYSEDMLRCHRMQAANSRTLIPLPDFLTIPYLPLNAGTIAAIIWGGLYVLLEPVAGTALALICLAATAASNAALAVDSTLTNQVAIVTHVVAWIAQFVGHGAFEGRAPALLDNLVQAIFLAPLFVWLELLFKAGYRRELQDRVEKAVKTEIAKFRATQPNGALQNKKAQ